MKRWVRWTVTGGTGLLGGVLGWLLGKGSGQGGLLLLFGLVGGILLAGAVFRMIGSWQSLMDRVTWTRSRMKELDDGEATSNPNVSPTREGGAKAVIDSIVASDPELGVFVPQQLAALPALLRPGEGVVNLAAATSSGRPGLFAMTDRRVLFLGRDRPQAPLEELPLSQVTSMAFRPSDLMGSLTLRAGRREVTFEMPGQQVEEMATFLRGRVAK